MRIVIILASLMVCSSLYSQQTTAVPAEGGAAMMSVSVQLNTKVSSSFLTSYSYAFPEWPKPLEAKLDQIGSYFVTWEISVPSALAKQSSYVFGISYLFNSSGSSSVTSGRGLPGDTIGAVQSYLSGGATYFGLLLDASVEVSNGFELGPYMELCVGLLSFEQKSIVTLTSNDSPLVPQKTDRHTISNLGSRMGVGLVARTNRTMYRLGAAGFLGSSGEAGYARIIGIEFTVGIQL